MRAPLIVLPLLALPACQLIDQRTFNATTVPPPRTALQALVAGDQHPTRPLVTIPLPDLDRSWQVPLIQAARAAVARKPDVQFDIITLRPADAALDADPARATLGDAAARDVATVLLGDEIPAERVHLGVRGDPGQPPPEVLVFVR